MLPISMFHKSKKKSITMLTLLFVLFIFKFPLVAQTSVYNQIYSNMVKVEGGTYTMGCTDGLCFGDELPSHEIKVNTFFISKYEVTQGQWAEIMNTTPAYFKNCQQCPIEKVNYLDIHKFLYRLNTLTGKKYRLPTEAEWEYAARGGNNNDNFSYSGSNNIDEVGWCRENSEMKTHEVGLKKPNSLGLFDMSGNVWEWCYDYYDHFYYLKSPSDNPRGAYPTGYIVVRGGSWFPDCYHSRISNRDWFGSFVRLYNVGFRLALDQ